MDSKKIFLTQEGFDELKKEFKDLKDSKRPQVVERVSQARNMGDLSENAEYVAARDELSFIDGRIDELEEILKQASVINGKNHTKSVQLGSTVTLHTGRKEDIYMVVGEWEADPIARKISHESPLGKALIGKKVGEEVEVSAPAGKVTYKIISVN